MTKYKIHKEKHPRKQSHMISQGVSKEEISLMNSIHLEFPRIKITHSDRTVLGGKEIDIYLPSYKIGIEYDGLRYHSSAMDKSPNYHLNKSILAEKRGVKIIHIFSDMWLNDKSSVLDYIKKQVGRYKEISIDECKIREITEKEGIFFFNNFHLNGHDPRAHKFVGIFYQTQLMGCLEYSDDKIYGYQDIRGYRITGAIQSIFEQFPEFKNYDVYCDRSLSEQYFWINEGFIQNKCTEPRLYYTLDFKERISEKLVGQGQKNGMFEVYDCGEIILKSPY